MESPVVPKYSPFGQPMTRLINSMEACHISPDQKSSNRSLNSTLPRKGSMASAEGLTASERSLEYLVDLISEKGQLSVYPPLFPIMERLMEEEINRVRSELFQCSFAIDKLNLPEPEGDVITVQEKVYVPSKDHPDYNFVGRILGPRGNTAKQLEKEVGCKIMVRGRGSMRDHRKEEQNRGKPNWEHLDDELHVLVQCDDTRNRVYLKLKAGVEQIQKLLIPTKEGSDELKRKQLTELAIINGTYRPVRHHMRRAQLMPPVALVSPLQQQHGGHPMFMSSVGSPITPGGITSMPAMNSYLHSPDIDYSMLFNQLAFDPNQASYSMGGGDSQPLTSPFGSTAQLPNILQSYVVDSTTLTPPNSAERR